MSERRSKKPKPGESVVLLSVPPDLLKDLPPEDRRAIREVVGKAIVLNEYDDDGRAELEFKDAHGAIHFIYVRPEFIKAAP